MIANIKEFEKLLIDKDLNRKKLSQKVRMSPTTLSSKLEKENSDFKLSEMVDIANELEMDERLFICIFFGEKLSSNESNKSK